MFKIIINLSIRYWVSEYCESPESFDYEVKAILIASSEEAADKEVKHLQSLSSRDLEFDLISRGAIDSILGDIESVNIWSEELVADI